jgi:hypothetical protein
MQLLIQLKAYQIIKNANQRHVPSRSSLTTEKKSADFHSRETDFHQIPSDPNLRFPPW